MWRVRGGQRSLIRSVDGALVTRAQAASNPLLDIQNSQSFDSQLFQHLKRGKLSIELESVPQRIMIWNLRKKEDQEDNIEGQIGRFSVVFEDNEEEHPIAAAENENNDDQPNQRVEEPVGDQPSRSDRGERPMGHGTASAQMGGLETRTAQMGGPQSTQMGGSGRGYSSEMFSYGTGAHARGFMGLRGRRPPTNN
ncbi:hypothetical protein QJS10_CPA01g01842 [Acorus calamus]|uniref:Uncharacterized protein n=1 Tax=Acorus calamus TaxID=4465 RepID=A0AAV9FGN3_ACOCL|nr:hypothetical protein QJS10_CPA01g01842 [Acorus calamus]